MLKQKSPQGPQRVRVSRLITWSLLLETRGDFVIWCGSRHSSGEVICGTTSGPMIQYLRNRVKQEHKIMAGGHTVTVKSLLGEQAFGLNFLYRLAPVGTIHQIQEVRRSDDRNEYA